MIFKTFFYAILLGSIFIYTFIVIIVEWAVKFTRALLEVRKERAEAVRRQGSESQPTPSTPPHPADPPPPPPTASNLARAALEVWRIQNRVNKISQHIPDAHTRGFNNSLSKLGDYFDEYGIQIVDPTGEPYNDGANVDVIAFETDPSLDHDIVKETLEPSIYENGTLIKRAKIIVHQKRN